MLTFEANIDEIKKIIFAKLVGDLEIETEVKVAIDKLLLVVETHQWFSLILDVSELEMPGIQAFAMLGRLGKDKFSDATKKLKKIAVVDNGKVADFMSAFFMKPPPNMFFDDVELAIEFISKS